MSRPARNSPQADPSLRPLIGRLCFAAAANAAGGIWGPMRLQRRLNFTPMQRVQSLEPTRETTSAGAKLKKSIPSRTCWHWLHGQVPQDQTLDLIARNLPQVAEAVREWRDGSLVGALAVRPGQHAIAGRTLLRLSEHAWGLYLGTIALSHANPHFEADLICELSRSAFRGHGEVVLAAAIAVDLLLQPSSNRNEETLSAALTLALRNAAKIHPEVEFVRGEILEQHQAKRASARQLPKPAAATARGVVVPFERRSLQSPCPKAARNLKFVTEALAELNRTEAYALKFARK